MVASVDVFAPVEGMVVVGAVPVAGVVAPVCAKAGTAAMRERAATPPRIFERICMMTILPGCALRYRINACSKRLFPQRENEKADATAPAFPIFTGTFPITSARRSHR